MLDSRLKPIHIFRPGRHTAMQGAQIDFSEADLAASARAYDPALHEAPLVVGHPAGNAPAYGWVAALNVDAAGLHAVPRQIDPAFAELVTTGRLKKISASFYAPDSPHNPAPGTYYLRHVGFLGAQPPAVKGLTPVEFADAGAADAGVLTLEFTEDTAGLVQRIAGIFRSLRDYFIDKEGLEKAEAIIPSWAADGLQEDSAVVAAKTAETTPAFHEPRPAQKPKDKIMPKPDFPVAGAASYAAPQNVDAARLAELEQQVASFQEARRREHAQSVIGAALAEGRLTPAQTVGLADFIASLPEADAVVSFGEGDNARTISQAAYMVEFVAALPKQVSFGEQSAGDHVATGLTPESAAREAVCYQERMRQSGIVISSTEAVAAVKAGVHKETARG